MNKKIIYAFIIVSIFFGTTISLILSKEQKTEKIQDISLINLIATPEKYHNTKVGVTGFASIEFEGTAIYLSKENFEQGIDKNAIWLEINWLNDREKYKKFDKKYVIIVGIFHKIPLGHTSLFSGSIEIEKIGKWPSRADIEKIK